MKEYINTNRSIIFLFVLMMPLSSLFVEKGALVKSLNSIHTPFLDLFFKNWTMLGEFAPYLLVGVIVYFKYRPLFLRYIFAIIIQILLALGLKWGVFSSCPRPVRWFSPDEWQQLHKVDGVIHANFNAFPSGHTMTVFVATSFVIFFLSKNTVLNIMLSLLALLVGISRVYLLQHFYIDVAFGALLGMICAICSIFVPEKFIYTE